MPTPALNKELSVASLSEFLQAVQSIYDRWHNEDKARAKRCGEKFEPPTIWFRGQSNATWPLRPKLYRLTDPDENEIRSGFKRRALQLMSEPHLPENEKGWYFLMQHYGAPTRLLDWTDGSLLALYFAIRESTNRPKPAAVWVLHPAWLNRLTFGDDSYLSGVTLSDWKETDPWFPSAFEQDLHPNFPLAVEPPHVARRVAVQRSCFTIHGTLKDGLSRIGATKPNRRLIKIIIRQEAIKAIRHELHLSGITETTVFPDLEGLSRELTWEFAGDN